MTAQIPEILILDGKATAMMICPPLPENHPFLIEDEKAGKRFMSTACRRAYQGTWEIKKGCLFLIGAKGRYSVESPIFADWFNGTLKIPQGELLEYVHMGFGSTYEKELQLVIVDGRVVEKVTIDNRPNS